MITTLIYTLFALDRFLGHLASEHSVLVFVVLFAVIFAETGLIVFPFLPGDSILFISGTIAAAGDMNVHVLVAVLATAAILGDSVNYAVGRFIGPRVFDRSQRHWWTRWIKPEYLAKTQHYYDTYGGFTIVIGRFIPIVRTFAPFLAGVAQMSYHRFLSYNISGGLAWILGFVYAGYLFGNIPWVKDNLTLIVAGIVIVSLMPAAIQFLREWRGKAKKD
jgi:membrane-associated protein